jgi:hypothetical protein
MNIKNFFLLPFNYYTIWSFFIVYISRYYDNYYSYWIQKNSYIQTVLGGFYITYIYPKKIEIVEINLFIKKPLLNILDIITHYLPIFLLHKNNHFKFSYNILDFFIINLPILCYLSIFNPFKKYHIRYIDGFILLISYFIIYFFFFEKLFLS